MPIVKRQENLLTSKQCSKYFQIYDRNYQVPIKTMEVKAKMSKKEFEEYIQTQSLEISLDKDKELTEWRKYLADLYGLIKGWMSDFVSKKLVKLIKKQIKIYEEFSGEYNIDALELSFNGKTIFFEPIGTMLIGAKGRVDIKGKNGKVTLVLVDKNSDGPNVKVNIFTSEKERKEHEKKEKDKKQEKIIWEWKILLNNDQTRYMNLDENNFFDILMGLTNG